jgi:hypothetical protein
LPEELGDTKYRVDILSRSGRHLGYRIEHTIDQIVSIDDEENRVRHNPIISVILFFPTLFGYKKRAEALLM